MAPSSAKISAAPACSAVRPKSPDASSSTTATWLPASATTTVRPNTAVPASPIQRYARSGTSTRTPFGTWMNTPPVQYAALSAANFPTSAVTAVPRYFRTSSGCSRTAASSEVKITPAA